MKRREAIDQLSNIYLQNLSIEDRKNQLENFLAEVWEDDEEWQKLPKDIQSEFNGDSLYEEPESKRYDAVLLVWLKYTLRAVTNEFLKQELDIEHIIGEPIEMASCPCCGRKTLDSRGEFEICIICWWEDDGQDNKNADEIWGGPNYGVSLTEARYYYQTIGIYNPKQINLKKIQEPADKYPIGRRFKLKDGYVIEDGTTWKGKVTANTKKYK